MEEAYKFFNYICDYYHTIIMKAILTGASGLIGKALLDQLISSNLYQEILAWVRRPSGLIDHNFTEMVLAFDEIAAIDVAW